MQKYFFKSVKYKSRRQDAFGFCCLFFLLFWEVWKPTCWLLSFYFTTLPFFHLLLCKNPAHSILWWKSKHSLKQRLSDLVLTRWEAPISCTTCFIDCRNGLWNVQSELTGFCDQPFWRNSGLNKLSEFSAIGLAKIIYVLLHTASLPDMNRAFTFKQAPLAMQSHCYRKPWREPMSQGSFEKRNSWPVIFYDHRQSSSPSQPSTSHPWNDRVGLLPKDC